MKPLSKSSKKYLAVNIVSFVCLIVVCIIRIAFLTSPYINIGAASIVWAHIVSILVAGTIFATFFIFSEKSKGICTCFATLASFAISLGWLFLDTINSDIYVPYSYLSGDPHLVYACGAGVVFSTFCGICFAAAMLMTAFDDKREERLNQKNDTTQGRTVNE